jgi:hypothetical protein
MIASAFGARPERPQYRFGTGVITVIDIPFQISSWMSSGTEMCVGRASDQARRTAASFSTRERVSRFQPSFA